MLTKNMLTFVTACLLLFSNPIAYAEQFKKAGDYKIHYNALNTDMLQPEVAQSYGIVRSKTRGMLNVAVRKKKQAVPAQVTATVRNLNQQLQTLEMNRVEEGSTDNKAIYYVGVFSFANGDNMDFEIQVMPEGQTDAIAINFRQEFFVKE